MSELVYTVLPFPLENQGICARTTSHYTRLPTFFSILACPSLSSYLGTWAFLLQNFNLYPSSSLTLAAIKFLINLLSPGSYSWRPPLCLLWSSIPKLKEFTKNPGSPHSEFLVSFEISSSNLHFQQAARWCPCCWPGVHWLNMQLSHVPPFCSWTITASLLDCEEIIREGEKRSYQNPDLTLCSLLYKPKAKTLPVGSPYLRLFPSV